MVWMASEWTLAPLSAHHHAMAGEQRNRSLGSHCTGVCPAHLFRDTGQTEKIARWDTPWLTHAPPPAASPYLRVPPALRSGRNTTSARLPAGPPIGNSLTYRLPRRARGHRVPRNEGSEARHLSGSRTPTTGGESWLWTVIQSRTRAAPRCERGGRDRRGGQQGACIKAWAHRSPKSGNWDRALLRCTERGFGRR